MSKIPFSTQDTPTTTEQICPQCGFNNSAHAKFCIECGTSLTQASVKTQNFTFVSSQEADGGFTPISLNPNSSLPLLTSQSGLIFTRPAERRLLTVMFCDLVGSTTLSEQLDPEELRELIQTYQQTCADVVMRFEGYIAQYLGDGILIYFGYPIAHEDDSQRSVRAALGIIEAVGKLKTRCIENRCLKLAVRLGVHTGLVVVGEVGAGNKREQLAIGQTPNLAARLQSLAQPNTAVLSPIIYRLVQDAFEFKALGQHSFKGISQPINVYQVLQEIECQHQKIAENWETAYIGRQQELQQLEIIWETVKQGQGQVVLLSGEAGIGKSRLIQAFKQQIATDSYILRELYCSPYYQHTPFHPFIEMLRLGVLNFRREDTPEQKLMKLESYLSQYQFDLPETVPLFAHLLSIPLNERYPELNLSPQAQKEKLLEALLEIIQSMARQQPVLVIVEDLHWIDPSSLELLNRLIEKGNQDQILRLCTARSGLVSQGLKLSNCASIHLNHLSQTQTEAMIAGITRGKSLPNQVMRLLIEKSDGIPLFVEEMTKMVLESGWLKETGTGYELMGTVPNLTIPDTLKGLLMERLDRLDHAKVVAQLGATIGREFSDELLRTIARQVIEPQINFDETTVIQGLQQLVDTQLLLRKGESPLVFYSFKSALIQDAAYETLLKSTRQRYHQQIAQILEQQFTDLVAEKPEVLAYHYSQAGLSEKAIYHWQKAGARAILTSANEEAIAHLKSGLDLVKTLPETSETLRLELQLQTSFGKALIATKGYGYPPLKGIYQRTSKLCEKIGDNFQLFLSVWGLCSYHVARAEYETSLELSYRLRGISQQENHLRLEVEAYFTMGLSHFYLGHLKTAHQYWEQTYQCYQKNPVDCCTFLTGQDVGVACSGFLSWSYWLLGYPEQALEISQQSLALAKTRSHPYSLGLALSLAAMFYQYRQEPKKVQEYAEAAIAISQEQGFEFWRIHGTILRGWALVEQGKIEPGITELQQGIVAHFDTGSQISHTYFLGLLASAYFKAGEKDLALNTINQALLKAKKTGERFWEAELYHFQGKLQFQLNQNLEAAKIDFETAIKIAQTQEAKALELKANLSLSNLL